MRTGLILAFLGTVLSTGHARAQIGTGPDSSALPDSQQVYRWAELFRNVLEEFSREGRSPVRCLEGDFPSLEIRVRADSAEATKWIEETLTVKELMAADLKVVAHRLYSAALTRKPGLD